MPSAANIPIAEATWMNSRFDLSNSLPVRVVLMYDRKGAVNVTSGARSARGAYLAAARSSALQILRCVAVSSSTGV